MKNFKIGDIVARKSYGMDVAFRIKKIENRDNCTEYILNGINYRVIADAPENDLVLLDEEDLRQENIRLLCKSLNKNQTL